MTLLASPAEADPDGDPHADDFEVATTSSDELRAGVRVHGTLGRQTVSLLLSILRTHIRAGRRDVRVDLADARLDDVTAMQRLREVHDEMRGHGGRLVFDHATEQASAVLDEGDLFVASV